MASPVVPAAGVAPLEGPATRSRVQRLATPVVILAVFFGVVVSLQTWSHAYTSELSGYPDETGHFVTGVLFEDYVKAFPPGPPVPFAENFYVHRPKVAIGHWPPLLYLLEGPWFLLFHETRGSALALMALICAGLGTSIFHVVRQRLGTPAGIAAGLFFISLSFVQSQASEVMGDMLVALWGFWATVFFAEFLAERRTRDMLWFAAFAVLTILTKNNGLYLMLVPPISIILTRRLDVLGDKRLWGGALLVGVPSAAWVVYSWKFVGNTFADKGGLDYAGRAFRSYTHSFYLTLGPVFLLLVIVSAVWICLSFRSGGDTLLPVFLSVPLSALIFHCIVAGGIEWRYFVPAISTLVPILFSGLAWLGEKLPLRGAPWMVRSAALLALGILLSPRGTFGAPPKPYRGFSQVADLIASDPKLRQGATLVSSSADGEGLLISEVTMRYPYSEGYMLRASKVLSQQDWLGRFYQARFRSADDTSRYLDNVGVDLVVVENLTGVPTPQHQQLLLETVQEHPDAWRTLGTFPQKLAAAGGGQILVYERIKDCTPSAEKIRQDMQQALLRLLED